jgi:hypothetical protein
VFFLQPVISVRRHPSTALALKDIMLLLLHPAPGVPPIGSQADMAQYMETGERRAKELTAKVQTL